MRACVTCGLVDSFRGRGHLTEMMRFVSLFFFYLKSPSFLLAFPFLVMGNCRGGNRSGSVGSGSGEVSIIVFWEYNSDI